MKFDQKKYLERIKYWGGLEPNLELLRKLQKNHLLNVPFENLDVHYQTPIELDINNIYVKVVQNKRGGTCYELNGLFYELLLSLGFDVKRVSGRVHTKKDEYSPEFEHLAIIVKIGDKEYLTDVGFGEFIFEPLELQINKIKKDQRGNYSIDTYENDYLRVNQIIGGKPTPKFIFKNVARELREFEEMYRYNVIDRNSHIMNKKLISLPTENGRITISGNKLKRKDKDMITIRELESEAEFYNILRDKFNIKLNIFLAYKQHVR